MKIACLILFFAFIAALFPGDISWVNDEPTLIQSALNANQQNVVATLGLPGSLGIHYGPLATWIYQLFLLFTHNLTLIVALKAILTLSIVALCATYVIRFCKSSYWCLIPVCASPYLYLYGRMLWDNCFIIPLSGLACIGFIAILKEKEERIVTSKTTWSICALAICSACLISLHLLTLPFVAVLLSSLVMFSSSQLRQKKIALVIGLIAATILLAPYIGSLIDNPLQIRETKSNFSFSKALAITWTPTKQFSFIGFFSYFLPELTKNTTSSFSYILSALQYLTGLNCLFILIGICSCVKSGYAQGLNKIENKVSLTFALIILLTIGMFLFGGLEAQPHYANALWLPLFYFLSCGIKRVSQIKKLQITTVLPQVAMMLLLIFTIVSIHKNGGNRFIHYGSTLNNKIEIAKLRASYTDATPTNTTVQHFQLFPHSLVTLMRLYAETPINNKREAVSVSIDYMKPMGSNGKIILNELND